ncbi:Cytochrome b5 [Coniochaeta hoffmannii]|uniref:NADH-cytochrome b5 reductase 1 n=1 Tax=Coniochaeta hoffmannii TaxID=91930 RepID=A0AA38RY22_9PEZI|nr:Cytochrome b5 [Coniochaeta hoffmannii]
MSKTYTLTDVQEHNTREDAWVIIHNKVYDITKYFEDHPGGIEILLATVGTDATTEFEETGHSLEANDILKQFQIGELPDEEHAAEVEVYRPTFAKAPHVAAVDTKKRGSAGLGRTITKLGVVGGLGATAWVMSGRDLQTIWDLVRQLRLSKLFNHSTLSTAAGTSSRIFWLGAGIATVAEIAATARPEAVLKPKMTPTKTVTAPARTSLVLNPQQWRSFKLVRKTLVSPNVYRFVFALPHHQDVLGLPTGQHIALRATIQGKSVSRSYTPVSNNTDLGRVELLVKVYEAGAMTKHLEGMQVGQTIEIRGPKGAMQYSKTYAKHIGMIAGGTGITPMYQLIRAICADESDKTKISLVYANNTEEDILLRDELDNFVQQCPDKFRVHYVLTKPPQGWTGSSGFITEDVIKKHLPAASADTKVALCGPPPMINAMKANLTKLGFQQPGAFSKVTDQVFLF